MSLLQLLSIMKYFFSSLLFLLATFVFAQDDDRAFAIDDMFGFKRIGNIQLSPDEQWIAFTVTTVDTTKDKSSTRLWMIRSGGGDPIPMTSKDYSVGSPRWSPDGKYLSFTAAKGDPAKTQVWTLNRLGGEAEKVTNVKQGVSGYEWSPDGKRLALLLKDPKPSDLTSDTKDDKKPQPHVIDRVYFKRDYAGYLDRRRNHIYTFTPGDSAAVQITSGDYDDGGMQWSPDGKSIAFVSNRSDNPDLSYNSDIWIVDADNTDKGASLQRVTENPVSDSSPKWSPDGSSIVYVTSTNAEHMPFSMRYLATIKVNGGNPKILTEALDRRVSSPSFSKDGKEIFFMVSDDGERYLASVSSSGKNFRRLITEPVTVRDFAVAGDGIFTLQGQAHTLPAVYALKDGKTTKLTTINEAHFSTFDLGPVEKVEYKSADDTSIEGYVIKPNDFQEGRTYPLILYIHGGPIGQYNYDFHGTGQVFAANGYIVLLPNPRGSTGHGEDFSKAIFADWGNKDYEDVMAGVDHLIDQGYIDENRLGVGGWSYGGILTNYVITKTGRFKAAVSGASLGLVRANFGHDQYVAWYNAEFGMPWENPELWERLSPFNTIEKITTPTLWMGGAVDWNVPIMNSEQMYLGMKALGRETQLVVYPGEHHGIRRPSFQKDRLVRWVAWFDNYLKE